MMKQACLWALALTLIVGFQQQPPADLKPLLVALKTSLATNLGICDDGRRGASTPASRLHPAPPGAA